MNICQKEAPAYPVGLKLCSMRRPEDIEIVNEVRPDYIGFIFVPGRSREVGAQQAQILRAQLSPGIRCVGVFIDADPQVPAQYVSRGIIDLIQLHGNEDASYLKRLRALTDAPVIKAFRALSEADIAAANAFPSEHVLLDAGAGGSGTAFDWSLLAGMKRRFFLAGGLHAGNVAQAILAAGVQMVEAVDVSSGVETDGWKDAEKIRAFAQTVRQMHFQG